MSAPSLGRITLPGVKALPPQVFGALSLVPLRRERPFGNLRLCPLESLSHEERTLVETDGETSYFVPHGVVTGYGERGRPLASMGVSCMPPRRSGRSVLAAREALIDWPFARRDTSGAVRMLPLHLTLEGLLYACLELPPAAWSRFAESSRASARERTPGTRSAVVESALRTFELHEGQCGVLLYAADELLFALLAPCAGDYAAMHRAVVADLLAGTLDFYARQQPLSVLTQPFKAELPGRAVRSLDDLREAVRLTRRTPFVAERSLAEGLVAVAPVTRSNETAGAWKVIRFTSELVPGGKNVLGEAICEAHGAPAWLTLHRLSDGFTRRAWALAAFAAAKWDLDRVATMWRETGTQAETQLNNAGFRPVLEVMGKARAVTPTRASRGRR